MDNYYPRTPFVHSPALDEHTYNGTMIRPTVTSKTGQQPRNVEPLLWALWEIDLAIWHQRPSIYPFYGLSYDKLCHTPRITEDS